MEEYKSNMCLSTSSDTGIVPEGNWVSGHKPSGIGVVVQQQPRYQMSKVFRLKITSYRPIKECRFKYCRALQTAMTETCTGWSWGWTFSCCLWTWVSWKFEGQKANELCRDRCLHRSCQQDPMMKQIQSAYTVETTVCLVSVRRECIVLQCTLEIEQSIRGREEVQMEKD